MAEEHIILLQLRPRLQPTLLYVRPVRRRYSAMARAGAVREAR